MLNTILAVIYNLERLSFNVYYQALLHTLSLSLSQYSDAHTYMDCWVDTRTLPTASAVQL